MGRQRRTRCCLATVPVSKSMHCTYYCFTVKVVSHFLQSQSRNIVVFSTEHAFTIEHGQDESDGPDLMLSYHGEEHYNSVRDDNAGKPPPPSKTSFEKPSTSLTLIESEGDETEAILETNHDAMDIVQEETAAGNVESAPPLPATTKPRLKKNDFCPCGSGRKYKKCCLASDRSKERARKWKAKQESSQQDDTMEAVGDKDEQVNVAMDGNFRVLKI